MSAFLSEMFVSQWGILDFEIWMEPFAGGAGAGLTLLLDDVVPELWLVEKNRALAALWRSILHQGEDLAELVSRTMPSMILWEQSRETLLASEAGEHLDDLTLGLAALVINRCSRSGMVSSKVGPIGGKSQAGRWGIGARFNAEGLAARIRAVSTAAPRIRFWEGDAVAHIAELNESGVGDELVLFVDPPYVREGNRLYANGMAAADHQALAHALNDCGTPWMLTYDDEPLVSDVLYPDRRVLAYQIRHTANRQRIDWEYAVFSDNLSVAPDPALLAKGESRWLRNDGVPELVASPDWSVPHTCTA